MGTGVVRQNSRNLTVLEGQEKVEFRATVKVWEINAWMLH